MPLCVQVEDGAPTARYRQGPPNTQLVSIPKANKTATFHAHMANSEGITYLAPIVSIYAYKRIVHALSCSIDAMSVPRSPVLKRALVLVVQVRSSPPICDPHLDGQVSSGTAPLLRAAQRTRSTEASTVLPGTDAERRDPNEETAGSRDPFQLPNSRYRCHHCANPL